MKKALFICIALLLTGIGIKLSASSYIPWMNEPARLQTTPPQIHLGTGIRYSNQTNDSIVMVVTMSGGGTRAGAFAYGVLEGLKETEIDRAEEKTNLFNEIDLISGVSGGSILATYATAYGERTFPGFKETFLYTNVQNYLIRSAFNPSNLIRLASPNYGRGNLFVDQLDKYFEGKKFSDLPQRPRLLITASDLSKARSFQFTPEQFALICSDLSSVPLAFAVGASSSVPIVFSPVTLKNYSGTNQCANTATIYRNPDFTMDYRMSQLYADKMTYLDASSRPFIHLMDGAISDNLGLKSIIDRVSMGDSISALISGAPPRSIKHIVFVVINSEIVPDKDIDQSEQTPDVIDVATALKFGKGMRSSAETLEILRFSAKDWAKQLKSPEMNTPQSIFTKDSQLHVIEVSLKSVPDDLQLRNRLMRLATTFYLPQHQVDELIVAGKNTLRASPEFQKLMDSLNKPNNQP